MKKVLAIDGMSCMHCVAHVKDALERIQGVESVEVSLKKNLAVVETEVADEVLKNAVEDEGYDVTEIR